MEMAAEKLKHKNDKREIAVQNHYSAEIAKSNKRGF